MNHSQFLKLLNFSRSVNLKHSSQDPERDAEGNMEAAAI